MATGALINIAKGEVENLIVADASDPVSEGYVIVVSPPDFVEIGTVWDGAHFIEPPPSQPPISTSVAVEIDGLETL
jgi:hypothetical protein